jgi:hypothetical protein
MAVGNITDPDQVNAILTAGRADLVALARPHLIDPMWTLRAAARPITATNGSRRNISAAWPSSPADRLKLIASCATSSRPSTATRVDRSEPQLSTLASSRSRRRVSRRTAG